MYSSLDRIDIVTRNKESGRHGYLLTDHRTAAEIEAEPELSVLFALVRVAAAKAMGEREGGADVSYVCRTPPPGFLSDAVSAAGGSLRVDATAVAATGARTLADIADIAFSGLAQRVAAREGAALDGALLKRLEDATLESPPKREEEEPLYWARVLELAALCGELLRAKTAGRWVEARDANGIFPFAFRAGEGTFNVADKAHRFLERGESQRPGQLLLMAEDLGRGDEGPMMVNLKPGDFSREHGIFRELLGRPGAPDPRMPLVFVGRDQPNSFAYLPAGSADAERSFKEALANLARLELEAVPHEIAGVKVHVVSGHFYASEKVLDEAFMLGLQRRLGAELLAAAVPYKGVLLVTDQIAPPGVAGFVAAASALHQNTGGAPALSPVAFLVKDGKVVGHIDTQAKPAAASARKPASGPGRPGPAKKPEPLKQGLWSRLFGRGH